MSYQIVPKNFHKDRASQCNMDTLCLDSCSLFLKFNSTVNLGFYMIHVTLSIVGTTGLCASRIKSLFHENWNGNKGFFNV